MRKNSVKKYVDGLCVCFQMMQSRLSQLSLIFISISEAASFLHEPLQGRLY